MNLKEVLKTLIAKFQEKKIDAVLSGGLALSTMDIFRFTKDIDFLIPDKMNMMLVREYFQIFDKEDLLDEWLDQIK